VDVSSAICKTGRDVPAPYSAPRTGASCARQQGTRWPCAKRPWAKASLLDSPLLPATGIHTQRMADLPPSADWPVLTRGVAQSSLTGDNALVTHKICKVSTGPHGLWLSGAAKPQRRL